MKCQFLLLLLASAALGCVAVPSSKCQTGCEPMPPVCNGECGDGSCGPGHGGHGHGGLGGHGGLLHRGKMPPPDRMMQPGPGVGGPGPGVIPPFPPMGPEGCMMMGPPPKSQIYFRSPEAMSVQWTQFTPGQFDSTPVTAPARYSFAQGAIYRLKVFNIPGREGVELYPTIEVAPALPRTEAFLAHSAIPIQFTEEDFDQVLSGNFVTKVIYLPDPDHQELAIAGVETLVSTRLDPGVDPVVEADRRGSILAIIRLGNKDLEMPEADPEMVGEGGMMFGGPGGPGFPGPGGPGFGAGPQWGIPITGTPIGLPGPPHLPLGVPAGLQQHTIVNKTHMHLPKPTERLHINVKERPGYSYPAPVDHIRIRETGP